MTRIAEELSSMTESDNQEREWIVEDTIRDSGEFQITESQLIRLSHVRESDRLLLTFLLHSMM